MTGLPKKYAKMGFKKGWREYRKVHGKRKGPRKKSSSKKRTYSKKKSYKRKKKSNPGRGKVSKKKVTQGDMNLTFAGLGPAGRRFMSFAESGDMNQISDGLAGDYTGFRFNENRFVGSDMLRGYGGLAHEAGYRKLCQMIGSRPYPSKKSFVEHLIYYGPPAIQAYLNKDNTTEAITRAYEALYGIDLSRSGFGIWQPAEMMPSKGGVQLVKWIKRTLRELGATLPKWV